MRWLTGGYGDLEGTMEYFDRLARNADAGVGKRGVGIWKAGRLCGYIDYDPDNDDGIDLDDVSISYAVHPWARARRSRRGSPVDLRRHSNEPGRETGRHQSPA